jgi:hypothetical protein
VKVKHMIAALQKADPELDICGFNDYSITSIEDVNICEGKYKLPLGQKLIMTEKEGRYVGLGNSGDFEGINQFSVCNPVEDLTEE